MRVLTFHIILLILISCRQRGEEKFTAEKDSAISRTTSFPAFADSLAEVEPTESNSDLEVNTRDVHPEAVIGFAKTLIGVPYKFGSTDPNVGFDCSGFITYVFNHFKIKVPRSSVEFTHVGQEVAPETAKPGDLILFTGTDSTIRVVGHMGIIIKSGETGIEFIHSTSGKAYGVTITPFNTYYKTRFVKVIRIFPMQVLSSHYGRRPFNCNWNKS